MQLVLRLIGHLYRMEHDWDANEWTHAKWRGVLRKRDFTVVLSLLKRVVLKLRQRSSPKPAVGKACGYLLARGMRFWHSLSMDKSSSTIT